MVNYRPLGKTELEVSEIGLGLWTLASGRWGRFEDGQALDLLRKAYDAGINYFDVAPTDGDGRGERLLGEAFRDRRELVIISSKAGRLGGGTPDFTPAAIRASLEKTLDRLASSYVDVLQLHYPDAGTVANPAVWQCLEDLKKEGKIRYAGIALGPGPGGLEEGRAAMRKHDLGIIQTYYNLLEEEPGRKFFPVALEINQGMVIRAPHAGGVLESNPDATQYPADGDLQVKDAAWIARARKQAENLRWVYEGKGMTLSQAALKFILSEETVASALPNIYREEQLAEYTAVSDFEAFSQVELGEIAEQFRRGFGV